MVAPADGYGSRVEYLAGGCRVVGSADGGLENDGTPGFGQDGGELGSCLMSGWARGLRWSGGGRAGEVFKSARGAELE